MIRVLLSLWNAAIFSERSFHVCVSSCMTAGIHSAAASAGAARAAVSAAAVPAALFIFPQRSYCQEDKTADYGQNHDRASICRNETEHMFFLSSCFHVFTVPAKRHEFLYVICCCSTPEQSGLFHMETARTAGININDIISAAPQASAE